MRTAITRAGWWDKLDTRWVCLDMEVMPWSAKAQSLIKRQYAPVGSGGGEGMVVKPTTFIARGKKGVLQPAIKVRGREYLRIVYGPDYDAPYHLERLKQRGLGRKRSLAIREFTLGLEPLERLVSLRGCMSAYSAR